MNKSIILPETVFFFDQKPEEEKTRVQFERVWKYRKGILENRQFPVQGWRNKNIN